MMKLGNVLDSLMLITSCILCVFILNQDLMIYYSYSSVAKPLTLGPAFGRSFVFKRYLGADLSEMPL